MTTENFTLLPEGAEVPMEGWIECCPRCGRNGIREFLADGSQWCVHVESSELLGDGLLVAPLDRCRLPQDH